MASVYPTNPDAFNRTTPSDNLTGHSDLHDDISDAVENIQAFVGVDGDTTSGTVVKRITDLEQKDFTVSFGTGSDLSGSFTVTNFGDVTNTTVAVRDDSHNHTIGNVDNLQTTLDGKLSTTGTAADSTKLGGAAAGSYLRSDADDTTTGSLTVGGVGKNLKIKDTVAGSQAITFATSDLTANRTVTFQNASGTVELTGHTHSYSASDHTHSYAASSHTHSYASTSHGHTNMLTGKRGNGSYYVDGNGYATITHGLGSTPVAAFVQTRTQISTGAGGGETVISLPVTSVTSTGVTFRAYEADAGNNNNSGYVSTIYDSSPGDTYVEVSWLVIS